MVQRLYKYHAADILSHKVHELLTQKAYGEIRLDMSVVWPPEYSGWIALVLGLFIQSYSLSLHFIFYKCKKHFIKMLKDVGMVVPKSKETRL